MPETQSRVASFGDLKLPASLLTALDEVGYETPSPIQARTIPFLLAGKDLLGHAPTGTGKTAAFALPLLARLDLNKGHLQVLVLAPTRELAIQVSEAFAKYARHMQDFRVLPIYGGQEYGTQIRQLSRGVHVVVGTPGRVMDHMRKGTLKLNHLQALVLDEADEMLRMGFIEDVEWILEQTPPLRQLALFSATMPKEIQRIAQRHLNEPEQITVKGRNETGDNIRQRYWPVSGLHKLDALTRILEVETFEGMLVFVRTRIATTEVAERLEARGYAAAALNGDMPQKQREQMIERLKSGALDILVATDVAARGLDVDRISHVINFDIPYDTEAYIHRIGRTGRAGRKGDAILFVSPRERRMLGAIEKATRQKIEQLELPTTEMVNNKRIAKFKQGITDTLAAGDLAFMQRLIEQYQLEHDVPALEIAAALATQIVGDRPLLLKDKKEKAGKFAQEWSVEDGGARRDKRAPRPKHESPAQDYVRPAKLEKFEKPGKPDKFAKSDKFAKGEKFDKGAKFSNAPKPLKSTNSNKPERREDMPLDHENSVDLGKQSISPAAGAPRAERSEPGLPRSEKVRGVQMEQFRIEVGKAHGVEPGNIVGAIANESGLESQYIGKVEIAENHSLVVLPTGMPNSVFKGLKNAWVCGQKMNISRISGGSDEAGTLPPKRHGKSFKKSKGKRLAMRD